MKINITPEHKDLLLLVRDQFRSQIRDVPELAEEGMSGVTIPQHLEKAAADLSKYGFGELTRYRKQLIFLAHEKTEQLFPHLLVEDKKNSRSRK